MTHSEILLERRQDGRKVWAQRVYRDGQVEDYRDRDLVVENGEFVEYDIPLKWRRRTRLLAEDLDQLIEVLRTSNFFDLPERLGDERKIHDVTVFTWTVNLDGQQKTVTAVGHQATDNPALKQLRETITMLTAAAYRRDAASQKD